MADTTISQFFQKVTLTEVTDVQVTEVVEADGTFTRAIRIYGTPSGPNIGPAMEIFVKSPEADNLKITTPELDF